MQIQEIPIKAEAYTSQYETMKRWYWRLQPYLGAGKETIFSLKHTYPGDFFEAFFIACYHLRDHLIESGIDKAEIDDFINKSKPLSLCADLCNLTKHVKLIHKPRTSADIKLSTPFFMYHNEDGQEAISSTLMVQDGERFYNPLKLTEDCIQEWNGFLESKGLPIPELTEEKIFLCFDKSNAD